MPDLRALALGRTEVVEAPGRRGHYNNFNPLLVGLALERAVGMPVAAYLEAKLGMLYATVPAPPPGIGRPTGCRRR